MVLNSFYIKVKYVYSNMCIEKIALVLQCVDQNNTTRQHKKSAIDLFVDEHSHVFNSLAA